MSKAPASNQRILIIDDEKEIALGIGQLLTSLGKTSVAKPISSRSKISSVEKSDSKQAETQGFDVFVCHQPQDALNEVKKSITEGRPFAVGFFDVMLGADIDGIELVRQIFEIDPQMFAVFVTAYQDRSVDSINQFLNEKNADRWDYLNKPFSEGEIIQKARTTTAMWNLKALKAWHEEQLSEAQKLLMQNERVSTVAAVGRSVAHEFGNLLMQIVGHAELSLMKNDPQRMKEALETILKASDTATDVLERFKKLSQGDEVQKDLQLIQVSQPLNDALDLMSYQFKKNQIEIKKVKEEAALLEAHRNSLVQVFMNIFINSVYVMPEGGVIELSIIKKGAEQIEIKIRDHGPGIPEDILPKVLQPLFTTKGIQGTGLGLAICKEIIEIDHLGELKISNHPEGGVEVCILLPTRQGDHVKA